MSRGGAGTGLGAPAFRRTLRPTPFGWGVLASAVLVLAAMWGGMLSPTPFFVVPLAVALVVPLAVWRHARGLRITVRAPATAFSGERFPLEVDVSTTSRRFSLRDVVLSASCGGRAIVRPAGFVDVVPPQSTRAVTLMVRAGRRGRYDVVKVTAETSFPLGLLVWRTDLRLPADVLVLPRLGTLRRLDTLVARRRGVVSTGAAPRGDEQELYGLHEWRPGESRRRIHWKLSARRGRPLVRELRGEEVPPVHVVLDTRVQPGWIGGSFERAVSLAATLVEQSLRRGRLARVTITGGASPLGFPRRRGRAALFPVLEALAEVAPARSPDTGPPAACVEHDEVALVVRPGRGEGESAGCPGAPGVRTLFAGSPDVARVFTLARRASSMRSPGPLA